MQGKRKNVALFNSLKSVLLVFLAMMLVIAFTGCDEDPDSTDLPNLTVKIDMVSIDGGSFDMGDNSSVSNIDERPVHPVSVSPFVMARYEVRYDEWQQVRDWATGHGYTFDNIGIIGDGDYGDTSHPVTKVNWYDAVKWCNALSEMEERTPCYHTDATDSIYRTGNIDIEDVWVKWDANGYRLPTEAEWEYACRAGHTTGYTLGNHIDGKNANFLDSGDPYDNGTTPVGYYGANDYGLYDMHGNAWEWCWDWYGEHYYEVSPASDPRGPSVGSDRVLRGGGWAKSAVNMRSANRHRFVPDYKGSSVGFRLVRSIQLQ